MIVTNQKGPRFGFPLVEMRAEEFNQLTTPERDEDLKYLPLRSIIRCTEKDGTVSPTVIGELVSGADAIAAQWGAGMSLPERFLNRYEVKLVESFSI